MEINEVRRLAKTRPLEKSERSEATSAVRDVVTLSPEAVEAQKKARFVEMLKEMAEVRMASTGNVERAIARKIYEQEFIQ